MSLISSLPCCLRLQNTRECGEPSSHHVVIEVVISRKTKALAGCARVGGGCPLQQAKFFSAADGRPAVADAELAVDILGVRPHRV